MISFIVGVFCGIWVSSGMLYQWISEKLDRRAYPPIGRMIDIGGYRLHACLQGEGPTVVFESGLGSICLDWSLVQPKVAQFAKTVSYDRGGQGWSEVSPLERTSESAVAELHLLLKNANVPGPYILVGHSLGGINARLYASRYPDEVAGIVLVDSSHEDQVEKLSSFPEPNRHVLRVLAYTGGLRLLMRLVPEYQHFFDVLPEDVRLQRQAMSLTRAHMQSVLEEMALFNKSCSQLKACRKDLGNKPLVVISAGKSFKEQGLTSLSETIDREWQALQRDLASKSGQGKQVIADHSGHMIPFEQPEMIVEVIREMLSMKYQEDRF
jgi:pimeloyl-ACP methyl ester carboxylesterase